MSESLLADYNDNIIKTITKHKKDYVRVISAYEGEGKSLFASAEALYFNPGFDVKTQAVYNLAQFLDFQDMYKDSPGKVCFMDEAVLQLLGEDNNSKEGKLFKKLFVTHRNKGHIYLLCSPSPWLMMPYIRRWRIRDCVIIYTDQETVDLRRRVAYYTKKAYSNFITDKDAADQIVTPYNFVKIHEPTEDMQFPMITDTEVLRLYEEMDKKKTETQDALRVDARRLIAEDALDGASGLAENKQKARGDYLVPFISRLNKTLKEVLGNSIELKQLKREVSHVSAISELCKIAGITPQYYHLYQDKLNQAEQREKILVTA